MILIVSPFCFFDLSTLLDMVFRVMDILFNAHPVLLHLGDSRTSSIAQGIFRPFRVSEPIE